MPNWRAVASKEATRGEVVNSPNSWNFSNLRTPSPETAFAFYDRFSVGHHSDTDNRSGLMVQVPGYGDHLASTVDPDIYQRQVGAPPGFADVVAGIEPIRQVMHRTGK